MVCLFFTQKYPACTEGYFKLYCLFLCLDFNFHQQSPLSIRLPAATWICDTMPLIGAAMVVPSSLLRLR